MLTFSGEGRGMFLNPWSSRLTEVDRVREVEASDILVTFQPEQKLGLPPAGANGSSLSLTPFHVVGCFFTSRSWLGIIHVNKIIKKTHSRRNN